MADSKLEWDILLDTITAPRRVNSSRQHASDILRALSQFLAQESLDRESHVCIDLSAEIDENETTRAKDELVDLETILENLVGILNKENDGRVSCVHELLEWVDERRIGEETR